MIKKTEGTIANGLYSDIGTLAIKHKTTKTQHRKLRR